MAWRIEFERAAARELDKLGSQSSARVLRFFRDRDAPLEDPRSIVAVIASESEAIQGNAGRPTTPGLLRRSAPRNDDSA
jgi:mRNA-degrading endonuclease RelE of RelBE toxin-antitoxin system